MRGALAPGVRRSVRLGAVERVDAPTATTVHVAGSVLEAPGWPGSGYLQRCARCGRVLAHVGTDDVYALSAGSRTPTELRERLAARFFAEERRIAEGPTATYLVSDRPLGADEQKCELVPPFEWE